MLRQAELPLEGFTIQPESHQRLVVLVFRARRCPAPTAGATAGRCRAAHTAPHTAGPPQPRPRKPLGPAPQSRTARALHLSPVRTPGGRTSSSRVGLPPAAPLTARRQEAPGSRARAATRGQDSAGAPPPAPGPGTALLPGAAPERGTQSPHSPGRAGPAPPWPCHRRGPEPGSFLREALHL